MNDKTEQALTDALIDKIESAALATFRRHRSSIRGQTVTAADNYDWHLLHAAYRAGIDTMRAQLAEAQRDSVRLKNDAAIFYEAAAGLLATNDALRTQLTEARRDAERWRFFRQASILPIADDHPFTILAELLNCGKASADDVDAAIDAAKGYSHRTGG